MNTLPAEIREKLLLAKKKDPDFEVFGSDYHQYELGPPLSKDDVKNFESEYGIRLPSDYASFLTTVGHGGPGYFGAAGPYYGIYPLRDFGYLPMLASRMPTPGIISSALTAEQWSEAINRFDFSEEVQNPEQEAAYDDLFSGLLPIGTMGDSFQMLLSLHGQDRGRVVYIDQDLQIPLFPPEPDFITWYMNWLNKLI